MERGIVTPALEITSNGTGFSMRGNIPAEKLRYYLLYWDKISITDSSIFASELGAESALLQKANVLTQKTARLHLSGTYDGSDLAALHFQGLAQIATELTQINPGQWTIHQSGDRSIVPQGMADELVTADFELNRCLPTPTADIPLERVLDFKLRHADELTALRQSLDELYLEIAKSADIPRAKIMQITRLEGAIADLDRVAKLIWGQRLLASRKVSLDINYGTVAQGVASGSLVGATFANPIAGLIAGAAQTLISSMKFEVVVSQQLSETRGKQIDLSYLGSIRKEDIAS